MKQTAILTIISLASILLGAVTLAGCGDAKPAPPNILLVVMDDVGIDQMQIFGYGGETPAATPTIAGIAAAGIRFRNTWAMPACSTSRAVFFDARFPFRTNVLGALGPDDLANSMVSPFETTAPKLLAGRGYESALLGKFHLALQGNDPAGYAMPHNLGWTYFSGWLDITGDPHSIDTTAGGVAPPGTWPCGFVPAARQGGADAGACYLADRSCRELANDADAVPAGRICRDQGGIFDPGKGCATPAPSYLNFAALSGHYVSPLVRNYPDGGVRRFLPAAPEARRFRAAAAVDDAIEWIEGRPADRPWMATVSFASDHTPLMQPPVDATRPGESAASDLDCADAGDQRVLSNLMIESLDAELGRLLVATGLAARGEDGGLVYRPERTNTMVIVVGDNGSLGTTVKQPFDSARAKGTAYQTGVWVPLVVAGPLVERPDRVVSHMVNVADLFALFAEIAGIEDVAAAVPRPIDAHPLLPYLTNPDQESLRRWNFTQVGTNLQVDGAINAPCTIGDTCTQIPVTKDVCEDNNGVWWGQDADNPITGGIPPGGLAYCCQVNEFLGERAYHIAPLAAVGIRDDRYKIVQNSGRFYRSQSDPCVERTDLEFYEINEDVPEPMLDEAGTHLPLDGLTSEQQRSFDALYARLQSLLASSPPCPGDGNIDFVVDDKDLADWRLYSETSGHSSVYDLNLDGLTNEGDRAIIEAHLGSRCDRE